MNSALKLITTTAIVMATMSTANAGMLWDSSYEDCRNSRIKANSTPTHAVTVTAYCREKFARLDAPGTGGRHVYRELNGKLGPLKFSEYRKLYPEYNILPDEELIDGMYSVYFRHMTYSDFYKALDVNKTK